MASKVELQSFVSKFNHLWRSGFQAELHLKCNAGEAFVNLNVGLGHFDVPIQTCHAADIEPPKKHVPPSRLRRRIRRENIRNNTVSTEINVSGSNGEVQLVSDNAVDSTEDTSKDTEEVYAYSSPIKCDVDAAEEACHLNSHTDADSVQETNANLISTKNDIDVFTASDSNVINDKSKSSADSEKDEIQMEVTLAEYDSSGALHKEATAKNEDVEALQNKVDVYATAHFKQCPNAQITQDEIDSLGRFLTSKDHLGRNISNISIESVFSDGVNYNGTFEHSVQVKLQVWQSNLWQGARSYVWKHLGTDIWERGNGTKISLSRIHQK